MQRTSFIVILVPAIFWLSGCGFGGGYDGKVREFNCEEFGFKVDMPGNPQRGSLTASGFRATTFTVEGKRGAFVVAHADMSRLNTKSNYAIQKRLDGAVKGMLRNTKSKLIRKSHITLQGYPGREVFAALPRDKGKIRARIYFVKGHLYQVLLMGEDQFVDASKNGVFFRSFKLNRG